MTEAVTIPTTRNRYDAPWGLCTVCVVPEDQEGRQEHGGELIPGPWQFVTTHALVIDNNGGSARERDEAPIKLELGEPVTVEGLPGTWAFRLEALLTRQPRRSRACRSSTRSVLLQGCVSEGHAKWDQAGASGKSACSATQAIAGTHTASPKLNIAWLSVTASSRKLSSTPCRRAYSRAVIHLTRSSP
jgi:hypothetical protein